MANVEKVRTEEEEEEAPNPFESASWLSKLLFSWMTPLVKLGTTRILLEEDVPQAPAANSSVLTAQRLKECWDEELRLRPHNPSLLRTIYRANLSRMLISLGNFVIFLVLTFLQPYLVSRILTYVTTGDDEVFGIKSGIAAALFLGFSAAIGALAFNQGFYHMQQFGLTSRTALIGILFQKSLNVSNTARRTYTAGEIITLMSVDVERIWLGILLSNWLVMAPPMFTVAIVLLWFQVGYASLVVAGALVFWGYFQEQVSGWIGQTRRKFVKHTAERAKRMNEILQGIRVVKLYAWEEATEARVNDVRAEEMKHLEEYLNIRMMNTILQFLGPVVVAFILFMSYSGMGGSFGVKKAYTCMAILNITRLPIALFPMARSAFQEAVNSIERIRAYLITPDMKHLLIGSADEKANNDAIVSSSRRDMATAAAATSEYELEMVDIDLSEERAPSGDVLLRLQNCYFDWVEDANGHAETAASDSLSTAVGQAAADAAAAEPLIEDAPKARIRSPAASPQLRIRSMSGSAPNDLVATPTTRERTASSDYQAVEMPAVDEISDEDGAASVVASVEAVDVQADRGRPSSPSSGPCSLNDVSLQIHRGDLVAIVGSVGTGKTSLLLAMLGQMTRVKGEQELKAKVAYASQEHWIQNLTVRDNILFDSEMDDDRYEAAMDASQLSKDLLTLNDGDLTEIGERGINLSGGQKARVNIARALYAPDSELFLLDDPLASVDVHVGKALFESVVLDLLKNKTVVVVFSSNYHFLPFFSKIIVVGKGGSVTVCSSYDELKASFPQYASVDGENSMRKVRSEDDVSRPGVEEDSMLSAVSTRSVTNASEAGSAASRKELGGMTRTASIYRSVRQQLLDRAVSVKGGMTMTAEDREKGEVSAVTYKKYFQASLQHGLCNNGWVVIGLILLSFTIGQTFRIYCDLWVGVWAQDNPDRPNWFYQTVYAGLMVGIILSVIIRSKYFITQCLEASRALHNGLLKNVLAAPINTYFDVTPIGRILNRFSKDLDQIDSQLPDFFLNMLQNSFHVLAIVVMCIASTPYFVIVMLPLTVLYYYIQEQFRKTSRELKRLEGVSRSPLYTLFGELLIGLSTVRAFKREQAFLTKFHAVCDRNNRFFFSFWSCSRWLALRLDLVGVVVVLSVAVIAVLMKQYDAPINSNLLGVALVFSLQLAGLLQWTVRTIIETENNMTSVERLLAFNSLELEDQSADPPGLPPVESWPSAGAIEMEDVVLRYRPGLPKVLNGISISIPGGAKVGVCGRTGAGKSSLMLALFRIVEPEAGSKITIDGVDTLGVSLNTLRSRLTIIPQDPVMFSGTLRYNLDPFHRYSDQEVWEALERVQLKEDVLEKFPMKLDHEISERGENISVGQRQLLCIARALLRKSKLIILDEATASVDSFTDHKIQEAIRTAFKECTVLTIAHRLETVADYDMIMVMDAGKVAEFAMPYELLQLEGGKFKALVDELGDEMRDSFVSLAKKRYEGHKDIYGANTKMEQNM